MDVCGPTGWRAPWKPSGWISCCTPPGPMCGCQRWEQHCSFHQQHVMMPEQWHSEPTEVVLCRWPEAGVQAIGVVVFCQLCTLPGILICTRTSRSSPACLHRTSTPALVSLQAVVYYCKSVWCFGVFLFVCSFGGFCVENLGFSWDFAFARNQTEIILALFSHTIPFVYSSKE